MTDSKSLSKLAANFDIQVLALILSSAIGLGGIIFVTQDQVNFKRLFAAKEDTTQSAKSLHLELIPLAQALQFFNSSGTIFLDVRAKKYYEYGHIKNARNLPVDQVADTTGKLLQELKNSPAVVVYCNGISCGDVYLAARQLMNKGLDNVKIYIDGWPEWRSCQLPMTMSATMEKDVAKELTNGEK